MNLLLKVLNFNLKTVMLEFLLRYNLLKINVVSLLKILYTRKTGITLPHTIYLSWLVAAVIDCNIPQTAQVGLEALRPGCVARVFGSSEDGLKVAINPVNIVLVECKAHWVWQISSNELPICSIKIDL